MILFCVKITFKSMFFANTRKNNWPSPERNTIEEENKPCRYIGSAFDSRIVIHGLYPKHQCRDKQIRCIDIVIVTQSHSDL